MLVTPGMCRERPVPRGHLSRFAVGTSANLSRIVTGDNTPRENVRPSEEACDDEAMPSATTPQPPDPEAEDAFMIVFSAPRIAILRFMAEESRPFTRAEIATGTGLGATWTMNHLRTLEHIGVVKASLPPDQRMGRRDVTWQRDEARIEELFSRLLTEVNVRLENPGPPPTQ